jgi:hypothetical protein
MRVSLTTRGGLAAAVNAAAPPIVVDTASLPGEQAHELTRLVRAAESAPPPGPEPGGRDVQSYTVIVDDDGRTTTIRARDTAMPDEVADLIEWIRRRAPR